MADTAPSNATNPAVLDFMKHRASCPWAGLKSPAPDRAALLEILEIAARVPDHAMLVPWRFILLQGAILKRLSGMVLDRGTALGIPDEKRRKVARMFAKAPVIVTVVFAPVNSEKASEWEQRLTTGAVCLNVLNAAQASGWGGNWLTGWIASDREFLEQGLRLSPDESLSGFIHLGTPGANANAQARPRPDVRAITTWAKV